MKNLDNGSEEEPNSGDWMRDLYDGSANEPDFSEPAADTATTSSIALRDVRETVLDEFDQQTWNVMETVMSAHLTLCIDGLESCFGLIIEGPSGSGKSTALRPFENVSGQFYRSDDVTPASFVSHDASRSSNELDDDDLLPRIKHKTLLNPEMANWFSGDWSERSNKWSRLVRVMDGRGFTSESGTHGQRGYTGDYRFNFVGATTPLDQNHWNMMGHTGNRFLFHEMPGQDDDTAYEDILFEEREYGDRVRVVTKDTQILLRERWQDYGGSRGIRWESTPDREVGERLMYLAELIRRARTPEDGEPESPHRVIEMLRNLARGHALLCGRRQVTEDDLNVCARVALSTMPVRRRRLIQELLALGPGDTLREREVAERLGVSRPTARKRMELIDTLGIGATVEETVQGGTATMVTVDSEFIWPSDLDRPEF